MRCRCRHHAVAGEGQRDAFTVRGGLLVDASHVGKGYSCGVFAPDIVLTGRDTFSLQTQYHVSKLLAQ